MPRAGQSVTGYVAIVLVSCRMGAANTVTAPSRTQQQPRYRHHLLLAGIKRIAVQERQGMLVRFGLPVWARVRRQNLVPSEGFVIGSLLVPCVW